MRWTTAARRTAALSLLLGLVITSSAETNLANRPVRALGSGLFAIGEVRLNKNERSITFPAIVNMREETVEYVVVHKTGKTHESIFRTETRPEDIHVAMLLLGAKPVMTNWFGNDGRAMPLGEKAWIEVNWTNANGQVRCPIEDVVLNRDTKHAMAPGEWIYNGSNFSEGAFTAQRDGSIVSIHIDPNALVNNPRPGRENDDLHVPNAARLPPMDALVQITIKMLPGGNRTTDK